jgi:L-amino acid N-acyltransferase YncA
MQKLAEAARENGISGLIAYTSHDNAAMINLFKTLPYKVKTTFDDDVLVLSCKFSEPKESK